MMVENGFSSPRTDAFPAGLRVLVVDDDPTWSKILEKMLKKCFYEVTTCCLAREALNLLRERKDGYDIVISDVNMPDMDGFKLLEHVGLEMDLPVIMMSVDGETRRVMKGVQHGACDYLLKPIRMKELRNIWQHVFRKKIHELRDIESLEGIESFHMTTSGSDLLDEDTTSRRKRKDSDNKYDDKDLNDPSCTKKARVAWTVDLHQKFVKAVNQIGFDKVGPKKILDLMCVPWLTRENVASHLQKYRLYLSRLQKDGDIKSSFIGMKQSDSCSKSTASVDINSMKNSIAPNVDLKDHEVDRKGTTLVPIAEPKRPLSIDIPDPRIAKSSRIGSNHFLGSVDSIVNFTSFDSTNMTPYSWTEIPDIQFKQECEPFQLENGFGQLPMPEYLHPAVSVSSEKETTTSRFEVKPTYDEYRTNHVEHSSPNHAVFEPISATTSSLKSQDIIPDPFTESDFSPRNMYEGIEVEDLQFCWLQGDCYPMNYGLQGFYCTEYNNPAMMSETPFHLYDASKFDHEHLFDPTEYCPIDHGLFA